MRVIYPSGAKYTPETLERALDIHIENGRIKTWTYVRSIRYPEYVGMGRTNRYCITTNKGDTIEVNAHELRAFLYGLTGG